MFQTILDVIRCYSRKWIAKICHISVIVGSGLVVGDWCYCAKLPHAEVQQILVFFSLCFARNCYSEQVQEEELNQFHQEQWKLRDYVKFLPDQQIYLSVIYRVQT